MKAKYLVATFLLTLLGMLVLESTGKGAESPRHQAGYAAPNAEAAPGSCTIFTISKNGRTFYGNNEDWINPNTYIWSRPGPRNGYGAVFFGFDDLYPQGGVNDQGLAFDWNALPALPLNPHPELRGAPNKVGHGLLANNATIDGAIEWLTSYSWGNSLAAQMHLADANGDAAVMSAGPDGELTFTRKAPGDGFLVSTNFNLAVPDAGGYPCKRYDRATEMLEGLMEEEGLAVEQISSVLDAVHQEGVRVNTVYANAIDLSGGVLYLYHWYQFDEVFELDIESAINRFVEPVLIRELFSQPTVDQADALYQGYLGRVETTQNIATAWLGLVGLSLVIQVVMVAGNKGLRWDEWLGWITGAIFLGPLAPTMHLISRGSAGESTPFRACSNKWAGPLSASVERAAVYSLLILFSVPYFILANHEPGLIELLGTFYLLPLLLGMLIFRGLPYAARIQCSYGSALRQLALTDVTANNLLFAGLVPSFLLLGNQWFATGIEGDDPAVWLALGIGTLAGATLVFPLEVWLSRRGFVPWPWNEEAGTGTTPFRYLNLRSGWPVLLMSFALAAGLLLLATRQLPI